MFRCSTSIALILNFTSKPNKNLKTMNELIKERNEIAKAIYLKNNILTGSVACNAVNAANEMMAAMYGDNWDVEEIDSQESADDNDIINLPLPQTALTPIVSIAEQNGEKGVRLCVGEVDIFIEAHNLDNGEKFDWKKAMARLEEVGKCTFTKHEGTLIAAYIDLINEKLREIGGEELDGIFWSSTEYGSNTAWYINSSGGIYVYYATGKYSSFTVRPCAAYIKA